MDALILVMLPKIPDWSLQPVPAASANVLKEVGIEPISYYWNKYIQLSPIPFTQCDLERFPCVDQTWHNFIVNGKFLNEMEKEVNNWIEEWDFASHDFDRFISEVFRDTNEGIFIFKEGSETINNIYLSKNKGWLCDKVRATLDRKEPLEGFAIVGVL